MVVLSRKWAASSKTGGEVDIRAAVEDHYDAVYRFCAARVGKDHAEDATQETFLIAQRRKDDFRGDSSVRTWLFGIAFNQCRALARKLHLSAPPIRLNDAVEPAGDCPENPLIDRHVLEVALDRLSPEHREVVLLHEGDGLTYEEAAGVLGIPVGTVKSRLHHAFLQLRRTLQGGLA